MKRASELLKIDHLKKVKGGCKIPDFVPFGKKAGEKVIVRTSKLS